MIPLLFGSSERQLLGVYTPALPLPRRRGVVICPPLGQEYIRSHRTCRILASRLAEQGRDVLRFDYFGTGNSGGEVEESSISGAIADTLSAIEEIKDLAAVRRVTLVGLRAGALIATLAASQSKAVDKLVMWDPVSDGRAYVQDEIHSGAPQGANGDREAQGFVFNRALQDELSLFSLADLDASPPDVLIVVSEDKPEHRKLKRRVEDVGASVEFECLESPPSWTEVADLGVGAVPTAALRRIAAW